MMIEKIEEFDKSFSKGTFLTKVDHIFIMILNAIMDNNMDSVKHYLSNEVYVKYNEEIENYKKISATRIFDEMNVSSTEIDGFEIVDNHIYITVTIVAKYMDYLIDNNGNFLSGNNTHRETKDVTMVFCKEMNDNSLSEIRRCPNCGHSIDINDSGVCSYCKGIMDMSKIDYIVKKMTII